MIILLPPILFESAINMETGPFFKNFGTINLYAIFGTLIATFITGSMMFVVGWIGIATVYDIQYKLVYASHDVYGFWSTNFSHRSRCGVEPLQVDEYG